MKSASAHDVLWRSRAPQAAELKGAMLPDPACLMMSLDMFVHSISIRRMFEREFWLRSAHLGDATTVSKERVEQAAVECLMRLPDVDLKSRPELASLLNAI
ncbi:MAG: hypothetical protein U0892_22260 [Pirellulales bacterium]